MFSKKPLSLSKSHSACLALLPALFSFSTQALAQNVNEPKTDDSELERVSVVGKKTEFQTLKDSAKAVDLIDTTKDQKLTVDIAEIMARTPGVTVRRSGGLGSRTRFSLNGLTDDQIRFFVDGVPIEMSGYSLGINNIPVNLVERIEVYHGVVPIDFGADALGGAINVVTDQKLDSNGGFSLQFGDFGTRRTTLSLNHKSDNGFFVRFNAYSDAADNDYEIDVTVPDEKARPVNATVERFHDDYSADGITLDLGITDQKWADHLQISLYNSEFESDVQHNINMSVPYGEVEYSRESKGVNLRYEYALSEALNFNLAMGIAETDTHYIDVADYNYNWFGEQIITPAPNPGEVSNQPNNTIFSGDDSFARISLAWQINGNHNIKFLVAPTLNERSNRDLLLTDDESNAKSPTQEMLSIVSGIEHTADLLDDRIQNILFIKHYHLDVSAEEPLIGNRINKKDRTSNFTGWGNAFRYNINDWSYAKASYEHATRLPTPKEIFGDGVLILENLDLSEEVSHNFNLGYNITELESKWGNWRGELNLFLRDIDDLIRFLPGDRTAIYQNIGSAKSEGVQGGLGWTSPEGFVDFDVNFTSMDFTNTTDGSPFEDRRIPNEPYKYLNASLRANWQDLFRDIDELSVTWNLRFVDEYSLLFSGLGNNNSTSLDTSVESQTSHTLGTTYSTDIADFDVSISAEVQNLTDEKLYDYIGVQKPGRSFNAKLIVNF
ncbi:TonB-dependent receptor plug domain-containing protein [Catenovulum sp. SM1970]|uniref:TonB-dependent receptor plug domain-containing protein n=1 Tax=Marinifaba aquimaris TaxID=2741323 RepID=UPI0015724FB3|nr:TonB-dependent receptor plug domain-containing protein [Marinifaba aquimaris]NTS77169.1 TonB-dependent receptor plug domain-containing protein [Marinifaba aquimaris]